MGISNEEIRSLFLAAIMVTSVIAIGGIGFAGSAAADPGDSNTYGEPTNMTVGNSSASTTINNFNNSISAGYNNTTKIEPPSEFDFSGVSQSDVILSGDNTNDKANVSASDITLNSTYVGNISNITSIQINSIDLEGVSPAGGLTYDVTNVSNGSSSDTAGFDLVGIDDSDTTGVEDAYTPSDPINITLDHSTTNRSVENVSIAIYNTSKADELVLNGSDQNDANVGSFTNIYNNSDTDAGVTKFEVTPGTDFAEAGAPVEGNYTVYATAENESSRYGPASKSTSQFNATFGVANLSVNDAAEVGDEITAEINSSLPNTDTVELRHNYTDTATSANVDSSAANANATFYAAKNGDLNITLEVGDGPTAVDVVEYNTTNYSVSVDPDTAVSGETQTIDVEVFKYIDQDDNSNNEFADASLGYNVTKNGSESNPTGAVSLGTGSTSNGQFKVQPSFDVAEIPFIVSMNDDDSNPSLQSNNGTAQIDVGYDISVDVSDPANPEFGDGPTIQATATDADGNGVNGVGLELRNASSGVVSEGSTNSQGNVFLGTSLNDATDKWHVYDNSSNLIGANITVTADQADLTLSADGTNQQFNPESYTVELVDSNEDALTINKTGSPDAYGYLNVTGPFANTTNGSDNGPALDSQTNVTTNASISSDGVAWLNVNITHTKDGVAVATFNATPTGDDVTAQLEVDRSDDDGPFEGVEDGTTFTNETPDYEAGAQTLTTEALGDLNVNPNPTSVSVDNPQDVSVTVTGADNLAPGDSDGTLANASVSLTGSGIDVAIEEGDSEYDNGSQDYSFDKANVTPEQGENITVEVTAQTNASHPDVDESETLTQTETITVDGFLYNNLTPTDVGLDERQDISVQIQSKDGVNLPNTDYVNFTHSKDGGFNATDTDGDDETGKIISVNTDLTEVQLVESDGTTHTIEEFTAIQDGTYSASDVKFEETGTVDFVANDSSTDQVNVTEAINVQGLNVYDIQTDVDPALAGSEEQHNITITEEGDRVSDTDLTDIVDNNNIDITQDGSDVPIVSGPTAVDLNDSIDNEDTIQVTINANNSATEPVNISVTTDGGDRSGEQSVEVVTPDVSTSLGGDALTLGLNNTDVEVTAEDPRSGDALAGGSIELNATNTNFEFLTGNTTDAEIVDDDTTTADLDENGSVTLAIGPNASEVDDDNESISLDISATQNGSEYFSTTTVDVGEITTDGIPDELGPSDDENLIIDISDANGEGIDLARMQLSGTGLNVDADQVTSLTDEGTVAFDITTSDSGTINVDLVGGVEDDDKEIIAASAEDLGANAETRLELADINVLEQAQLNLTADQTEIQQGDTVTFTLTREDFEQTTNGELTVFNADDEVVETGVEIDETVERTFDSSGEFTVEAEKPDRAEVGKAFVNDSVGISVAEPAAPDFQLELVDGPTTITQNESYSATVDVTNNGDADGSQTIEYELNGTDVTASEDVSLNASESTEVTFDVAADTTADIPTGNFTHEISSDDDEVTLDVEVIAEDDEVPATFDVSGLQPQDATVNVGEEFTVTATIENTGDLQGEQDIELLTEPEDGSVLDTEENVSLDGGNSTTVAFENISVDTAGEFNHTVASEDDSATGSLTVEELEAADFTVSNVQPDGANVTAGDMVDVTADIENVGGQQATQSVEFRIVAADDNTSIDNASATATQDVTLDAGANDTVTFENVSTDGLAAGDYTHGVFSENDSATATITVEEDAPAYYTLTLSHSIADRTAQTTTISTFFTYRQSGSTALLPRNVYRYTRTHTGGQR